MGQLRLKTQFGTQFIERFLGGSEMYQSVEELKEAENNPKECGRINWDVWNRVVQEGRQQLSELFNDKGNVKPIKERQFKEIWVYDFNGNLKGHFSSAKETAERMNLNKGTIAQMAWRKKPYYTMSLIFSYHELTKDEVMVLVLGTPRKKPIVYTNYRGSRPKEKWVYDLSGKLLGNFNSSEEVARHFDIERGAVNYYSWKGEPYYKKGLIIRNQPMDK